jgi:histidyl-tRNA synthetase
MDGVRAEIDHDEAPIDEQRARASALGARLGIVVREEDLHAGQVLVEDHGTDRRELVALGDLESTIRQRVD